MFLRAGRRCGNGSSDTASRSRTMCSHPGVISAVYGMTAVAAIPAGRDLAQAALRARRGCIGLRRVTLHQSVRNPLLHDLNNLARLT
jgi:hypothetical protein